jgi:hypothetical protein
MDKQKTDQIRTDVMTTLAKHKISDCVIILRQLVKDHEIRVLSFTSKPDNQECTIATLLEKALHVSKNLRDIFDHMASHTIHNLIQDIKFEHGGKKAD